MALTAPPANVEYIANFASPTERKAAPALIATHKTGKEGKRIRK